MSSKLIQVANTTAAADVDADAAAAESLVVMYV